MQYMRLFDTTADAQTYLIDTYGYSVSEAQIYLTKHTVTAIPSIGDKIWVILPS